MKLFDTADLERGLDLCTLRNEIISDNIANASNPDYQAKALVFEEQMQSVVSENGQKKTVIKPTPVVVDRPGSVDIISEMAGLSKNQILFEAYTTQITREFSNLKWIIDNAGR